MPVSSSGISVRMSDLNSIVDAQQNCVTAAAVAAAAAAAAAVAAAEAVAEGTRGTGLSDEQRLTLHAAASTVTAAAATVSAAAATVASLVSVITNRDNDRN